MQFYVKCKYSGSFEASAFESIKQKKTQTQQFLRFIFFLESPRKSSCPPSRGRSTPIACYTPSHDGFFPVFHSITEEMRSRAKPGMRQKRQGFSGRNRFSKGARPAAGIALRTAIYGRSAETVSVAVVGHPGNGPKIGKPRPLQNSILFGFSRDRLL